MGWFGLCLEWALHLVSNSDRITCGQRKHNQTLVKEVEYAKIGLENKHIDIEMDFDVVTTWLELD